MLLFYWQKKSIEILCRILFFNNALRERVLKELKLYWSKCKSFSHVLKDYVD